MSHMVMISRAPLLVAAAALSTVAGSAFAVPRHVDTEEDLLPRIQRETDPAKKAKYQIRLARLKLESAITSCEKDDHEKCREFLGAFLDLMKNSWRGLQTSGRKAVKQPQGFKELDIALREDGRLLEDLKRRIPYEDRGEIDKVIQDADRIRMEVLKALFPVERGQEAENTLIPRAGNYVPPGKSWP